MTDAPVVIAGGGIAGLSTALAIARAGRRVRVFERDPNRSEEGAGVQLSPNATRRLKVLGVLDSLRSSALAPEAVVVRRGADATVLARMDLRDAEARWGAPFLVAHRADLHRALAAATEKCACIELESGRAVTGWRKGADLHVQTTYGEIEAAALIVADGVRSTLRTAFVGEADKASHHSGRIAWRALIPADDCPAFARVPASTLWLGPDVHLVHYPLRGGSVVNVVAITSATRDGIAGEDWSRSGDARALIQAFGGWSSEVRALLLCASEWRVWPLLTRAVPQRLARERVALAGDAAHPMMPFLAQGAAQAIEDAAALGAAFTHHSEVSVAMGAYQLARARRVTRIVAASERQAAIYHLNGVRAAARDLAMRTGGATAMRLATDWIYRE